ncbi:biosynthetic-type acetolactate synthase large subunit [Buchnera aphidicola]|uniref:Acetolactate synthase n=1 Tax=Buchnera aphidicola (Anoecia oenotherae) TaxID=1241833 RepID=A0A4D6XV69_9GAMM|nr:biosynthetic-type acetolactate synthase large subunit [Buchnera aphidicola]QCI19307.1 biosynthetic-type acetolactate synthase large subunit [Buchnera aphidicola (Anoecia oenotherae)]
MKLLSGAEIVIQSLIDQKVEYIFGYPGGAVLDIYDALKTSKTKINHILVRHEQGATHMADGYSRSTGKTGVVLVTSGPGATNAITGIATAFMDSIPMVIISGQVALHLIGYDAFQECDMIGISRPIVKHSFLVQSVENIAVTIKKAFWIASTGRPGPVVIDLPKNILNPKNKIPYYWPKTIKFKSYNPKININKKQIKIALELLIQAKKPVIYIGGGIITSNSHQEIRNIAEKLNIPVTTSLMGLGGFPGTHEQHIGMLGMHGTYEANMTMHYADVIFAVGVRFDDRTTNDVVKYCPNAKIIHIDIDATSISKIIKAQLPILGNAKDVLKEINSLLKNQKIKKDKKSLTIWWKKIKEWRDKKSLQYEKNEKKIKPQLAIQTIWKLTKGKAFVTSDVGQHQMFTALYYLFEKPRRWINSGGLGTMGFGLPAALGVKLAFPKETVICITGDGSIQMNIQELSTAMQYNIPILIMNLNNRCLGMVKQWQDMLYSGRHSHSYMESLPDFIKLSESYGHVGIRINSPLELSKKLMLALKNLSKNKLVFVDIIIDSSEHVYPMQIKGGAMNEMILRKNLSEK